jgi:hypothetical protein
LRCSRLKASKKKEGQLRKKEPTHTSPYSTQLNPPRVDDKYSLRQSYFPTHTKPAERDSFVWEYDSFQYISTPPVPKDNVIQLVPTDNVILLALANLSSEKTRATYRERVTDRRCYRKKSTFLQEDATAWKGSEPKTATMKDFAKKIERTTRIFLKLEVKQKNKN